MDEEELCALRIRGDYRIAKRRGILPCGDDTSQVGTLGWAMEG